MQEAATIAFKFGLYLIHVNACVRGSKFSTNCYSRNLLMLFMRTNSAILTISLTGSLRSSLFSLFLIASRPSSCGILV